MKEGLAQLAKNKELLYPILFTLVGIVMVSPATSLLAAIVHEQGGNIVQLGLLGGAASLGALSGAIFAGMKSEGNPLRTYPLFGLLAAAAMTVFTFHPLEVDGGLALYALGFLAFTQAVWNTSRVPRLADPAHQARFQSITSMAFTLGAPLGAIWGGITIDRFGLRALTIGAGLLTLISLVILAKSIHFRRG
jgi:predicted MFS family arabinose efflux permease